MEILNLATLGVEDLGEKLQNEFPPPSPRGRSVEQKALAFRLSEQDVSILAKAIDHATNFEGSNSLFTEIHPAQPQNTEDPDRTPMVNSEAYACFHRIATKITSAMCIASGQKSSLLSSSIDDLPSVIKGGAHNSHVMASCSRNTPAHIDRGLFNLVFGTLSDLEALMIVPAFSKDYSVADHLRRRGDEYNTQHFCIMLPGLTAQLLTKGQFTATQHAIFHKHSTPRNTLVFQWRLGRDFAVPLGTVLDLLPSVRQDFLTTQGNAAALPPKADNYVIIVQTLTGKSLKFACAPNWRVLHLKRAIEIRDGYPIDQQRIIGHGQQFENYFTLSQYEIGNGDKVHLVLKLSGD